MKEYVVIIEEVLTKQVRVTATDEVDAENQVQKMYKNKEVVLTAPDNLCTPTTINAQSEEDYDREYG